MSLPLLLAQVPPAEALKDWLLCVGFLVGIGVGVKKLFFEKKSETPQPLKVQNDPGFVTVTAHEKTITEIKAELTRHAGRRAEIYDTQKKQGAQLAALDAKTDLMNAQLQNQDGKIDRILERLPRKS